jgi:hypothetical protein
MINGNTASTAFFDKIKKLLLFLQKQNIPVLLVLHLN